MDNDHDILVSLKTLMDVMIKNQTDFYAKSEERHANLVARISILEQSDSRDSERFKGIMEQIQRSLNNTNRITELNADVDNLADGIRELKAKSNLWDAVNSVGLTITGIIGYFFGGK